MKAKRFILMLLVMLMSVTGAWAEKEVDYSIISNSSIYQGAIENIKQSGKNSVVFDKQPATIVVDAQKAIYLLSYILTPYYNFLPSSVSVEGSNDQSSWTMLVSGSYSFQSVEPVRIDVACEQEYQYYRFVIGGSDPDLVQLSQIQIYANSIEGDGTSGNPYLISTPIEWKMFYEMCATNPAICGKLTKDIDLGSGNWNPEYDFTYIGTLDGGNHVISNLSSTVGLFRKTGAATIKNLGLANCNISSTDTYCGALAAEADGTVITNCFMWGNITAPSAVCGGLVGMASGNTQLTQCYCATGMDDNEIRPTFVSTETPGHYSNLDASMLVDDSGTTNEWCTPTSAKVNGVWNIVVSTGTPVKLNSIKLWNARNTVTNYGRTWKKVKVYGSNSANGPWGEPIGDFDNLDLAINNYGYAGELEINAEDAYTFYRIDVLENKGGTGDDYMQMADMKFVVTSPQSLSLPICGSTDGSCTATLCYHYGSASSALSTAVAKDDVASGRLAFLLDGSQINANGPYYQKIGIEKYPILTGGNYVYQSVDGVTYSNECPHRDHHLVKEYKALTCFANGQAEYYVCNNTKCKKIFFKNGGIITKDQETTLSGKPVIVTNHSFLKTPGLGYEQSKSINGTKYYNVTTLCTEQNLNMNGDYIVTYTNLSDETTITFHEFFEMKYGNWAVPQTMRYYVNGEERTALKHTLVMDNNVQQTHKEIVLDDVKRYDIIKIVYSFSTSANATKDTQLYIAPEQPTGWNGKHSFQQVEATYDCVEGGYDQHYECEICGNAFSSMSHNTTDEDLVPLSSFWLEPTSGAHNFTLSEQTTEEGLLKYACQNDKCSATDPDHFCIKNAIGDTNVALTYDGETYTADEDLVIPDGKAFCSPVPFGTNSVTYSRYYPENIWSAWCTPFDVNASYLQDKGLTPAYIEGIHNYDDNEDGTIDRTVMEIVKISNGRLRAGTPLLVRAAEGYSSQLTLNDVTMTASDDLNNIHTETATSIFDFIGTYAGTTAAAADNIYSLNNLGAMVHRTGTIQPLRWYCQIEQKPSFIGEETSAPALARAIYIRVIGEEDQTTGIRTLYDEADQTLERADGIFDLSGRKLSAPQHGKINIINGKKQFVK